MKKLALIGVALMLAAPAFAQQQQPDPAAAVYKQLLSEANDRVAALAPIAATLDAKVKELTKALEEEKAKTKPAEK
jgi:phage shock protein A